MKKLRDGVRLWLIGLMRVLGTSVDLQLFQDGTAQTIVGNHALHSVLDQHFRVLGADLFDGLHLLAADVTGNTIKTCKYLYQLILK